MDVDNDLLCDLLAEEQPELADMKFAGPASPEDLFSIFESLDAELARFDHQHRHRDVEAEVLGLAPKRSSSSVPGGVFHESETELETDPPSTLPRSSCKRPKINGSSSSVTAVVSLDDDNNFNSNNIVQQADGQQRVSHITVERNRRKQMNEHLTVLRSLMPCFYVKRGDQASIIGGVIDYINELQQVLQSLEAKKQRKVYTEAVMSPRPGPILSPRPPPLSPRPKPLLSPRLNLPISPRTPQPPSPYKPRLMQHQGPSAGSYSSSLSSMSPTSSPSSSINESVVNELAANSKSALADVEVKLSGVNLLLRTVSPRIPGQVSKIISALEELFLEILHVNISSMDETMVNSFTIKIGIECQLSAEELAHKIQHTFLPQ